MLSLNGATLFFTLVNILVLFLGLKKFLFKPLMGVVDQREAMVRQQLEGAREAQDQAEQLKEEYQQKLDQAQVRADEILVTARERAEEEHAQALRHTQEEMAHMQARAQEEIRGEQEKARQEAQLEIAALAMEAARKILRTGDAHDAAGNK